MKTVMIGAGNVATNLAKALAKNGNPPAQIWSRSLESAVTLASLVGSHATADWDEVMRDGDIYILSVSDDAMEKVIGSLVKRCHKGIFIHTAGTMSMRLFAGKVERYGVVYPMQTFSKSKEVNFRKVPCFVEASDAQTLECIMDFARSISDNVRILNEENRKWLHVAAVFACNFANACNAMAAEILESHGLDYDVMLPLVDEMVAKLHHLHPKEAQTGPASRGDAQVVGRHLDMLADNKGLGDIYKMLSKQINASLDI